jgi:hypothetical protein
MIARSLGGPSPDPRFGSMIELCRRHASSLFNLIVVGKTLPGQRIAAKEPPPALLHVEPTCAFGNEEVLKTWVPFEPSARLQTVVATEIVRDDENIPFGIVGFDLFEEFNVVPGIARGRTTRDLLAIAYPQRSVHPGFLRSSTVVQWCFDTVPRGRPAWSWWKGSGNDWP